MIENKLRFADEEEYLLINMESQRQKQFKIEICSRTAETLNRIKNNNYSVIVADYLKPGMRK